MADGTNTAGNGGQNNNDNANVNVNDAGNTGTLENDPVFAKHLDIAIEAQDGKKDTNTEAKGSEDKDDKSGKQPAADDKNSKSGTGDGTAQQQPNKEGKENKGTAAGPKDLTLQDGTVIKGGQERRFYEQRELARQQLQSTTTTLNATRAELQKAQDELKTVRASVESVQGAAPQDVALGVRILRDLKADPVGAMKKLLAEVIAQGHTIEGIGAGVDQLALQRMLDDRLGKQNVAPQQTEEQLVAEAQAEATQFFSNHPDARTHEPLLARVLNDHPHLSLEDAYFQSKAWFIENGYDWSQPLNGQMAASNNTQQQQQDQQQPKPIPGSGNSPANGAANVKAADQVDVAHEDTSIDDIIRQSMKEAGLLDNSQ